MRRVPSCVPARRAQRRGRLPHAARGRRHHARDGDETGSDQRAGRVAWSARDPSTGYFVLMTVTGDTPVQRVPVPPRSVLFDVDLEADAQGETIAAYSRCHRDPPPRRPQIGNALAQMPEWSAARGCNLHQFNFTTGRETRIAGANAPDASQFLPTVWKTRVAFARVYERRRGRLGDRAYLYIRGVTGADASRQVPAGNRSRLQTCSGRPVRCLYSVEWAHVARPGRAASRVRLGHGGHQRPALVRLSRHARRAAHPPDPLVARLGRDPGPGADRSDYRRGPRHLGACPVRRQRGERPAPLLHVRRRPRAGRRAPARVLPVPAARARVHDQRRHAAVPGLGCALGGTGMHGAEPVPLRSRVHRHGAWSCGSTPASRSRYGRASRRSRELTPQRGALSGRAWSQPVRARAPARLMVPTSAAVRTCLRGPNRDENLSPR